MRVKTTNNINRAFTLIELCVCMIIIAVLIALTIYAVIYSREKARKVICLNNLRQIGLALNSYNSALGCLPLMNNGRSGFSPQSMILPNLEQMPVYNSINFDVMSFDRANKTASGQYLSVFACPSDYQFSNNKPVSNYPANVGVKYQVSLKFNGVFNKRPDQPVSLAGIADGSSYTSMMAEWVVGPSQGSPSDPIGSVYRTPKGLNGRDQFEQFINACEDDHVPLKKKGSGLKSGSWLQSGLDQTLYNHNIRPNGHSCINGTMLFEGAWTASSRHSNGVNTLFCDGRVTFIKSTISIETWRALGTRDGGELINGGEF